ncbi:MAG: cyclic nucleotide-binding domain-containing protein [Thermoanaerobaculia bacterium]|nr:cyclic nucleotide-binding domain-containing protein [Thermoanaerobaculia bacterium]
MTEEPRRDVALLTAGRLLVPLEPDTPVTDESDDVCLLVEGSATALALTPLGPHPLGTLRAPCFLTLHGALTGATRLCRFDPGPGAAIFLFSGAEARQLLFDPSPAGAAFRKLALASVTTTLREVNAALARFFDDIVPDPEWKPRPAPAAAPLAAASPADPRRVHDLFDAAGLDPTALPELGLTERRIPSGSRLLSAGEKGSEAYVVAEGRLRVSMRIPGVGEEALAFLGPGEVVGEMALVDDSPRSADVQAQDGAVTVFALSREVFRTLVAEGAPEGAPLLGGIVVALVRRVEESVRKAATFRVLAGPF